MKKINYNNKIIYIMLIFAMSLASVVLVSATSYVSNSAYLRVVAEEITPEPVEPGQDVTVKIRLINEGGDLAKDVSLKLNADYPFFVKTESNNFEDKRDLCAGCSMDNTYYLVVDANAKSGLYPLNFEIYKTDESKVIIKPSETIDIKVVGKPDIVLETRLMELNVSSGDKFKINFNAKNIGTGIARKIKIIPQSDDILMIGSNVDIINEINPDENTYFDLDFIVKESLDPDTYKFPIKLEYVDEQGTAYETSFDIGVNVLNRAEISFQSIKITPITPTLVDEVHLEGIIENTDTGDAEKVVVELITSEGKTYKSFIGQLKSDDDSPFYFDLKPESIGIQTAKLKISYYDDFGFHSYETDISKEVKKPTTNIITLMIVLVVLLAGIGYFFVKKKKN